MEVAAILLRALHGRTFGCDRRYDHLTQEEWARVEQKISREVAVENASHAGKLDEVVRCAMRADPPGTVR